MIGIAVSALIFQLEAFKALKERTAYRPPALKASPYQLKVSKLQAEGAGRALFAVCRQVWVEARKQGCPNADDPAFTWAFLRGYSTLGELLSRCSPSSTLDCSSPERYGCYLLKRALLKRPGFPDSLELVPKELKVDYNKTVSSVDADTEPCAVDGTLLR